jgi:hypothetical protein
VVVGFVFLWARGKTMGYPKIEMEKNRNGLSVNFVNCLIEKKGRL